MIGCGRYCSHTHLYHQMMAYQIILLGLAFAITILVNFLLALMIIKLKRQEELKTANRRRHFDVLFAALAVSDIIGPCLTYPILIHLYHLNSREKEISEYLCSTLSSSAAFYFSFVGILTVTMDFHHLVSGFRPFCYFIYLRKKESKIPFLCLAASLLVALVSLTLSANGLSFFNLATNHSIRGVPCALEVSLNLPSRMYFFIIGNFCFWTHFISFVVTLRINIKTRNANIAKFGRVTGKRGLFGLLSRTWFQMVFKMIYLIFWTPFMVVMTIVTCSNYRIPTDILVTVCYLVFLPGLVGPFVHYVTHQDLRDLFNTTIRSIVLKQNLRIEEENAKDIGMRNISIDE